MPATVSDFPLPCCHPFLDYAGPPIYWQWVHSKYCKTSRRRKLTEAELDVAQPRRIDEMPARYYPDAEQERHQAEAERDLDEYGCPAHGGYKPWRECPMCESEVLAIRERGLA